MNGNSFRSSRVSFMTRRFLRSLKFPGMNLWMNFLKGPCFRSIRIRISFMILKPNNISDPFYRSLRVKAFSKAWNMPNSNSFKSLKVGAQSFTHMIFMLSHFNGALTLEKKEILSLI